MMVSVCIGWKPSGGKNVTAWLARSLLRAACIPPGRATATPRPPHHPGIAMIHQISAASGQAYLATYRLPHRAFSQKDPHFATLDPVWDAMREGDYRIAAGLVTAELEGQRLFSPEERTAMMIALANAELLMGKTDHAKRTAGKALDLFPNQWSGHRILIHVLHLKQAYKAAYLHLRQLEPGPVPLWDAPVNSTDRHTALAAWSWLLGEWERVADHLQTGFPDGIGSMPPEIQEDWFRLALYRGRPQDAVAVATLLIEQRPVDLADELLQTFVQNGWTKEALPLYRAAYQSAPDSQLLRRRLVALCIREGELDEARDLTRPGALDLAA